VKSKMVGDLFAGEEGKALFLRKFASHRDKKTEEQKGRDAATGGATRTIPSFTKKRISTHPKKKTRNVPREKENCLKPPLDGAGRTEVDDWVCGQRGRGQPIAAVRKESRGEGKKSFKKVSGGGGGRERGRGECDCVFSPRKKRSFSKNFDRGRGKPTRSRRGGESYLALKKNGPTDVVAKQRADSWFPKKC